MNASRYKKTLGPTKVEKVRPSVTKLTFLIHVRKRVRSVKNIMLDLRPDLFTKNIFISTTNRFSLFGPCCRSAKITEALDDEEIHNNLGSNFISVVSSGTVLD